MAASGSKDCRQSRGLIYTRVLSQGSLIAQSMGEGVGAQKAVRLVDGLPTQPICTYPRRFFSIEASSGSDWISFLTADETGARFR